MDVSVGAAQREQIDGVTVWWREVPTPFTGSLVFRAGRADEVFSTSGLSHMVEHLALFPFGKQLYGYNGFVDHLRTGFYAWGHPQQVVEFLRQVSEHLVSLPLDRLEQERRVLITEDDRVAHGSVLADRFGAQGFGLLDYAQWGLRAISAEQILGWTQERFTRDNCVVSFTGRIPEGFSLDLPRGTGFAPPEPMPIAGLVTPSHVQAGEGHVSISMAGPRDASHYVSVLILQERAMEALRRDLGVSYQVASAWMPLGPDHVHSLIEADVAREQGRLVARELVEVVNRLLDEGPTPVELAHIVEQFEVAMTEPMWGLSDLESAVMDELTGRAHPSPPDLIQELREVSPDDARIAIQSVMGSAILSMPEGVAAPAGRFETASFSRREEPPADAREYERFDGASGEPRVFLSGSAISLTEGDESIVVDFDDAVALLRSRDGVHTIVRSNGGYVSVNADTHKDGLALVNLLAAAVPDRIIDIDDLTYWRELQRIVSDRLSDRASMWEEVRTLSGNLEADEPVLDLALGSLDGAGIVVMTDRRIIHITRHRKGTEFIGWRYANMLALEHGGRLGAGKLTIVNDRGKAVVSAVRPREQATRFSEMFPALKAARDESES
jgi:zinc protease